MTPRYHGLDALRAFAMLLGIALHGGMSYVGAYMSDKELAGWPYDPSSSIVILIFIVWIHTWRMQVFFMMAGFFAHLVIQRRGLRSFMKNRFRHVFLPFVLGLLIIVPLTIGVIIYGAWVTGTLDEMVNAPDSGDEGFSPLHLWFLYYLIGFYLITAALYVVAPRLRSLPVTLLHHADRILARVMLSRWRVVWLALPTMVLQAAITTEDVVLFKANGPFFVYQGFFYAFGWLIFRQPELLKPLGRRRVWLGYLLSGTVVVLPLHLILTDTYSAQHLVYTGVYSLETWLIMLGLVGMFDALNSRARIWVRYLADAAYWIYLMHMPLVALLSTWLIDLRWAALPKFIIVCAATTILLLVMYQWGVRYTIIGRLLNGPRQRGELRQLAVANGQD